MLFNYYVSWDNAIDKLQEYNKENNTDYKLGTNYLSKFGLARLKKCKTPLEAVSGNFREETKILGVPDKVLIWKFEDKNTARLCEKLVHKRRREKDLAALVPWRHKAKEEKGKHGDFSIHCPETENSRDEVLEWMEAAKVKNVYDLVKQEDINEDIMKRLSRIEKMLNGTQLSIPFSDT